MIKEIYIIGGGTSLKDFDFKKLKDKDTLCINNAIFHVPNPTYFITMDYIFYKCRLPLVKRIEEFNRIYTCKIFVANMGHPNIQEKDGRIVDISTSHGDMFYDLQAFNMIIKSFTTQGIGTSWIDFRNGNHSGHCALQLAVLLGYDIIHLLGFDYQTINKKTHFHEGYHQGVNKFGMLLGRYCEHFYQALKELNMKKPTLQIYNYSDISILKTILPTKDLKEILW